MSRPLLSPETLGKARIVAAQRVCDHCLGRGFGKLESGLSNAERGALLREALQTPAVNFLDCTVCEGLFGELDEFATIVLESLEGYEYDNYLVGTRVDPDLMAREQALWQAAGCVESSEKLNSELNREIGKRVHAKNGKPVEFGKPQITVLLDTRFNVATLTFGGYYLFGRYRKLERGLPQTVWPCRRCRGRGCNTCNGTGKLYEASVQELIEAAPKQASGATETAFHGAGREDIDARCLGSGRPFVLELKNPKTRALDVAGLEREINETNKGRVEVEGLRIASKEEVAHVKEFRGHKTYLARVVFADDVTSEKLLKAIGTLRGCVVAQRTPSRVSHRRADLVRKRQVHSIELESLSGREAQIRITGDAGLYIKELVSGDEGRTTPSVAELTGVPAKVEDLDILGVEYESSAPLDEEA
ncbi:MAG TPA: tRNA pseudouridine(54/55) synthase Pus10 [Candidatus Thermoplasmatota archaeon]|nr:tRNA pseudouridine(54/55) synthase Pus10 [Candidatus Thermoplasmatota archaeon]